MGGLTKANKCPTATSRITAKLIIKLAVRRGEKSLVGIARSEGHSGAGQTFRYASLSSGFYKWGTGFIFKLPEFRNAQSCAENLSRSTVDAIFDYRAISTARKILRQGNYKLSQKCLKATAREASAGFSQVPSTKVREIAAMLKAIHAGEDIAAARQKAVQVIEKLRGLHLTKAAELVETAVARVSGTMCK